MWLLIICFAGLLIGFTLLFMEYWIEVVRPINQDILQEKFNDRAQEIYHKIIDAKTLDDCRRIQSNVISFDRRFAKLVNPDLHEPVSRELWGLLDARYRIICRDGIPQKRDIVIGEMTIDDLLDDDFLNSLYAKA